MNGTLECPLCLGGLERYAKCDNCGSTVDAGQIGDKIECPLCNEIIEVSYKCQGCSSLFTRKELGEYGIEVGEKEDAVTCPICYSKAPKGSKQCPNCGARFKREKEEITLEQAIREFTKIPSVGKLKAKALYEAGFKSLMDIYKSSIDDLSKVPHIGKKSAKKIKDALGEIKIEDLHKKEVDEGLIDEEYECPLCGTIVSAYETSCYECGAEFEKTGVEEEGGVDTALKVYERKIENNPKDPSLWYAKASTLSQLGRHKEALEAYNKVIDLDPSYEGVWNAKAEIHKRLGEHEAAAECIQKAMEVTLLDITGIGALTATVSIREGKKEQSEDDLIGLLLDLDEQEVEEQCPLCGAPLAEGTLKCPDCGAEFEEEEAGELAAELEEEEKSLEMLDLLLTDAAKERIDEESSKDDLALLEELVEAEDFSAEGTKVDVLGDLEELELLTTEDMTAALAAEEPERGPEAAEEALGLVEDLEEIGDLEIEGKGEEAELELLDELDTLVSTIEEEEEKPVPTVAPAPRQRPQKRAKAVERKVPAPVAPPMKAEAPALVTERRGLTNGLMITGPGLTNGMGRTNGMTNGMTNGITNGMTNGLRPSVMVKRPPMAPRQTFVKRNFELLVTVCVIVFILVFGSVLMAFVELPMQAGEHIQIDGDFSDWSRADVRMFDNPTDQTLLAGIDIERCGFHYNSLDFYLYLRTRGNLFGGANDGVDAILFFIDSDGDESTGYSVGGIGAEKKVEILGWDNRVYISSLASYPDAETLDDNWAAWSRGSTLKVAINAEELETAIGLKSIPDVDREEARVICYSKNIPESGAETSDVSMPFAASGAGILIEQDWFTLPPIQTNVATEVMELTLHAGGEAVRIDSLNLERESTISPQDINSVALQEVGGGSHPGTLSGNNVAFAFSGGLTVEPGSPVTLRLSVNMAPSGNGKGVGFRLREDGVTSDAIGAVVSGRDVRYAYVESVSSGIQIDGLFGDWDAVYDKLSLTDSAGEDLANENIDIGSAAVTMNNTDHVFFYMDVAGRILYGADAPISAIRTVPGQGGEPVEPTEPSEPSGPTEPTPPRPPITGEDYARIYIHTVSGAELKIEVLGKLGEIESSNLYRMDGGTWTRIAPATAANDADQMEVQIPASEIQGNVSYIVFETTDWAKRTDELRIDIPEDMPLIARSIPLMRDSDMPTLLTRGEMPVFSAAYVPVLVTVALFVLVPMRERGKRRGTGAAR